MNAAIQELMAELEQLSAHYQSLMALGRVLEQLTPTSPVAKEMRDLHRRFAKAYIAYGHALHRLIDALEFTEGPHADCPPQRNDHQPRSGSVRAPHDGA